MEGISSPSCTCGGIGEFELLEGPLPLEVLFPLPLEPLPPPPRRGKNPPNNDRRRFCFGATGVGVVCFIPVVDPVRVRVSKLLGFEGSLLCTPGVACALDGGLVGGLELGVVGVLVVLGARGPIGLRREGRVRDVFVDDFVVVVDGDVDGVGVDVDVVVEPDGVAVVVLPAGCVG
jgi:hypothetical protein